MVDHEFCLFWRKIHYSWNKDLYISVLVLQKNTAKPTIHEIRQISWNPPNFMHEICRISWQGLIYTAYLACNRLIHVYLYWFCRKIQQNPLFMKSGRFHGEIWQISSWNPADFMKSGEFHEIWQISWLWVAPDWIYDRVQYRASKFNDRDRIVILSFWAKWLPVKKYMRFWLNISCASIRGIMWYICKI